MGGFQIRKASKNDIPKILELLYDLGRPKPEKDNDIEIFEQKAKRYISDSDKEILIADHDGNIAGMISLMFLPRLNQKNYEMYIPELIVVKDFQNQGIGKQFINSSIKLAKEKKCHRIRLESGNQRKESHQFYKNLGFEQSALLFTKNLK